MKTLFRNYLADAVLLILIGLFLFIRPYGTLAFVCRLMGIVLLVMGAVKGAAYYRYEADRSLTSFLIGVLQCLVGIALIIRPAYFISLFPLVAGLVIAYGAVVSIAKLVELRKYGLELYPPEMMMAVVTLILAVIVILHPAMISVSITQIIGVGMILEGLTLVLTLMRAKSRMKRMR